MYLGTGITETYFSYINGTALCASLTIANAAANPDFHFWVWQDKLILSAISLLLFPKTLDNIMLKLLVHGPLYQSLWQNHLHVSDLRECLIRSQGNHIITEYVSDVINPAANSSLRYTYL